MLRVVAVYFNSDSVFSELVFRLLLILRKLKSNGTYMRFVNGGKEALLYTVCICQKTYMDCVFFTGGINGR